VIEEPHRRGLVPLELDSHAIKKNNTIVLHLSGAATREIGLEVSADKTKYMVMSRNQNAGRIHSVRIDNSTFERVEKFKYLGNNFNKSEFYCGRN